MHVPVVKVLEQCSEFSRTVEPYIGQLQALPSRLGEVFAGSETLLDVYVSTNPLVSGFAASVALGAVFLVISEINRNYSQVDRLWSILPTLYNAHYAIWARLAGQPHQRVDAVLFYSVLWSIRLTFNYWRRGGYQIGSEDYRWEIIRKNIHPAIFHVFNWTFISFIQSILLFFLAAPTYIILLSSQLEPNLSIFDLLFVATELGLISIEIFADQQQWDYHAAKSEYRRTAKVPSGYQQADLDRGFVTSGLWAYSRHPAFAAEQSIWFVLYQWSCYASRTLYSWAALGPVFLIMLFQGSAWLTELISSGKYSDYKDYQKSVGMFVPVSLSPYKRPTPAKPKVIRTSDLAKRKSGPKQN